jgi:hypothetical protein
MNSKAFWEFATALGWIDLEQLRPAMTGTDRLIALQAIASRATGSPAEAGLQILAGIAVLNDGAKSPAVVLWPKELQLIGSELDRAAWHESERDRLTAKAASDKKTAEQYWANSFLNPERRAPQGQPGHQQALGHQGCPTVPERPEQEFELSGAQAEEHQVGATHSSGAPQQEANDES